MNSSDFLGEQRTRDVMPMEEEVATLTQGDKSLRMVIYRSACARIEQFIGLKIWWTCPWDTSKIPHEVSVLHPLSWRTLQIFLCLLFVIGGNRRRPPSRWPGEFYSF